MKLTLFGVEISFSFWFFVVLMTFALIGREQLLVYLLLPVVLHEAGHLLIMAVCRVKIRSIRFTAFSVDIEKGNTATLGYGKEILINLGGVLVNLIAALWLYCTAFQSMRVMLLIAVNLAIGVFNILPVGNLDGGEILRLLLERRGNPGMAAVISRACSFLLLIPLFAAAIFMLFRGGENISLLLACCYLAAVVIIKQV